MKNGVNEKMRYELSDEDLKLVVGGDIVERLVEAVNRVIDIFDFKGNGC